MYPNIKRKKTNEEKEKERTKYRAKPVIVHEQFVCSVSEIQTEYSSLDNMSLYRYRLHKIDSWHVPK